MTGRTRTCRAFTLVEGMIVIVVIGLIAAIATSAYQKVHAASLAAPASTITLSITNLPDGWQAITYTHDGHLWTIAARGNSYAAGCSPVHHPSCPCLTKATAQPERAANAPTPSP